MKYVLFAATIILIALSSEAQAPTGIDVQHLGPRQKLTFGVSTYIAVHCSANNQETLCFADLNEDAVRKLIGVPNTQK